MPTLRTPDDDLIPLLRTATSEDLETLAEFIRQASTSELIEGSYWVGERADYISAEIQKFGGNTIMNLFRGGTGVCYAEVVRDVADKLGVSYNDTTPVATIEGQIQIKILEKAYEKMTDDERRQLLDAIGEKFEGGIPAALPVMCIQAAIRLGGFAAYQIALMVANAVAKQILGHGLRMAANAGIARGIGIIAGPIGWAVTILWTLFDIAGPAYRISVPCVLQVAYIRQKSLVALCPSCGTQNQKSDKAKFCQACGAKLY